MFGLSFLFWRFDRIVAPSVIPVTLAEVREHCRIDEDDTGQDDLIELWIAAAVETAEKSTGRSLLTQTWRATADRFPICGAEIELRHGPVARVVSVTYVDSDGNVQTLDPSAYVVDLSGRVARLAPVNGANWPVTRRQLAAVKVTYVAGYGDDATAVPKTILQWMLVRVSTQYEHRDEVESVRGKLEAMPHVDGLLDIHREVPV